MIISVFTTDTRGAGTNANVFIQVYDFNGKRSEEISLDNKTDNFEPGQTDRFTLNIPQDLETLYKIRIWHDGSRPFAGWHLDKGEFQSLDVNGTDVIQVWQKYGKNMIKLYLVFITNPVSGERYDFSCQNWLASDEGDGEIIRELPATADSIKQPGMVKDYKVLVKTGNEFGAGTDANVFINIFGSKACFRKRQIMLKIVDYIFRKLR